MEREIRRIVYIKDLINRKHCQFLKPNMNGGWNKNGKRKSVKGVYDLLFKEGIRYFRISNEVWDKLDAHMMGKKDITKYFSQTKII